MEAKDRMIQKVFEFTDRYISDKEAEQLLQEGRKEVVDFVEEHMCNLEEWTGWQEQKEEWGIKPS